MTCSHHIAKRSGKSEIRNIVSPESSQIPVSAMEWYITPAGNEFPNWDYFPVAKDKTIDRISYIHMFFHRMEQEKKERIKRMSGVMLTYEKYVHIYHIYVSAGRVFRFWSQFSSLLPLLLWDKTQDNSRSAIMCPFSASSLSPSPGCFICENAQSHLAPSSERTRRWRVLLERTRRDDAEIRTNSFRCNTSCRTLLPIDRAT